MKKRITHIVPLRSGIVIGVLVGVTRAILAAIAKLLIAWVPQVGIPTGHNYLVLFLWGPAIYAGLGFAAGLIGAAVYNLTVKWTGGFVLEIQDVPPANQ